MSERSIIEHLGLKATSIAVVHGGDINETFCVTADSGKYFLKINDEYRYPQMFGREAEGLAALANGAAILVPHVIQNGSFSGQQFLLLEWIERGTPTSEGWEKFGIGLASLHKKPQQFFGWHSDNYIGSLPQSNTPATSWVEFYSRSRILPLVKMLFDKKSFNSMDVRSAESFCKQLGEIYPAEQPSLLHGDLWSGNFMFDSRGGASIFDPAVYCGHREIDIAMTRLFGGFDERFYEGYQAIYPVTQGLDTRLKFSQLYPLLVHAVLFGGSYVNQAASIIKMF